MIETFDGPNRFLSNFYDCLVDVKGRLFASSEHAYQAAKTTSPEWQEKIRLARSPREAKHLGYSAPLRDDWDDIKVNVMRYVLECKFAPGSALAAKLLATGDLHLQEGNHHGDDFWGVVPAGVGADGQIGWRGRNYLGQLLMERREALRDH